MIENTRARQILERDYSIGSHQSGISGRYQIPRRGLVGEWLLNGNANDSSPNGYNGTATNVTWVGAEKGYVQEVGNFGTSSKVQLSAIGDYDTWGFSFMYNSSSSPSGNNGVIFSKCLTGGYGQYASLIILTDPTGKLSLSIRPYNGSPPTASQTLVDDFGYNILDGEYKLIQINIVQNGTAEIYVNNKIYRTYTIGTIVTSGTAYINDSTDTYYSSLAGKIGLFRIYNRILSQSERQSLYLEGLKLIH